MNTKLRFNESDICEAISDWLKAKGWGVEPEKIRLDIDQKSYIGDLSVCYSRKIFAEVNIDE